MKVKDIIYREDAIKALHEEWDGGWLEVTGEWVADNCEAVLNRLPSADRPSNPHDITYINALKNRINELEADRPEGEWIVDLLDYKSICSLCGANEAHFIYGTEMWYGLGKSRFCPYCGRKMKGTSNGQGSVRNNSRNV